jgi:hypothetical protein
VSHIRKMAMQLSPTCPSLAAILSASIRAASTNMVSRNGLTHVTGQPGLEDPVTVGASAESCENYHGD